MTGLRAMGAAVGVAVRGLLGLVLLLALFAGIGLGIAVSVVDQSAQQVQVPLLRGTTIQEAEERLRRVGLTLKAARHEFDDDVPPGRVIRSKPGEGMHVRPGRLVECVLSLGPKSVTMPRLVGRTLAAAERQLNDTGLTVSEVRRKAAEAPRDEVLEQVPPPGSKVGREQKVLLVVSGGPRFGTLEASQGPPWVFRRLKVTVPRGAPLQRVEVKLQAGSGQTEIVYDRVHRPGDVASVSVVGRRGWRVSVTVDDKEVLDTKL